MKKIKPPPPHHPMKREKFFIDHPDFPGAAEEIKKIRLDRRLKELQNKYGRRDLTLYEFELLDYRVNFTKENIKTKKAGLLWVSKLFMWAGKIIGKARKRRENKIPKRTASKDLI